MKKISLVGIFLAFSVFFSGIAQNTPLDMAVAIHAKGVFKDRGNKQWIESGINGKGIFNFVETNRTSNAVFLLDSSRNVRIEINSSENMVYYSDSSRTRVALYPLVTWFSAVNGRYYRVRVGGKCLQAVELADKSFSPELMPCGAATLPSQQWNIIERNVNGVLTYRWRNLLTQMRGASLCVTATNVGVVVGFRTCDTSDAQRWLNFRFNTGSGISNIRTLAVQDNICLGTQYSTQGAPRFRENEDGIVQKDLDFITLRLAFCDERNDSSNTNNPLWNFQTL